LRGYIPEKHCGCKVQCPAGNRDVITALPLANVDLLMQNPPILSMYTQIKNHGYLKPYTMVGKTGYKWEAMELEIHD
jgi:hypothetical protein